jgi:hypothetical protein
MIPEYNKDGLRVIHERKFNDLKVGDIVRYNEFLFEGNSEYIARDVNGGDNRVGVNYAFKGEATVTKVPGNTYFDVKSQDMGYARTYYRDEVFVKGVDYT